MTRRVPAVAVSGLLLGLSLVVTMAPEVSGAKGVKIKKLSHTHPDGESFSYFCGKVKGKPGKRYIVKAKGPAVADGTERFKMGKKGTRKVIFEIQAPGTYFFILKSRAGKVLDKDDYEVPPPPPDGARIGPFHCIAGV